MRISFWLHRLWKKWLGRETGWNGTGRNARRLRAWQGGAVREAEVLEERVVPAIITVNSLADTNTFDRGSIFLPPGFFSDQVVTFREAVQMVNQGSTFGYSASEIAQVDATSPLGTDDIIRFAPGLTASGPATITMVGGQYNLGFNVQIQGPGTDKLSFDAGLNSRIFNVPTVVSQGQEFDLVVGISGLTLKNGNASQGDGGVIHNSSRLTLTGVNISGGKTTNEGGGVFNRGTLTVENSTISGSNANFGGAIANSGRLFVNASTIEGNSGEFRGGGIHNFGQGQATVSNSTFARNLAGPQFVLDIVNAGQGGGIDNEAGAVTVINSTFVENNALFRGAISATNPGAKGGAINNQDRLSVIQSTFTGNTITADGGGAGIFGKSGATTRLFNSILVDNRVVNSTRRDDVSGFVSSDSFGNLTGQRANPAGLFNGRGNYLVGTSLFPAPSMNDPAVAFPTELANLFDPQGLRDNGGPTRTIALQAGSFAIDKGFTSLPGFSTLPIVDANGVQLNLANNPNDQRGGIFPRAYGNPDLGAFEFIPQTLVVTSLADGLNGADPKVTLREAVTLANAIAGDNTITFDPALSGTITLTQGELSLTDTVGTIRILGPGPSRLAIDGNNASRIFNANGSTAEFAGLTLQNGNAGTGSGGGISSTARLGNRLTVSNVTFKNNRASEGGGIFALDLIVGGSTFEGNVAEQRGGGIFVAGGHASVFNSTFVRNVARGTASSDLTSESEDVRGGGGIAFERTDGRLENCTFYFNQAVGVGGGIAILRPNTGTIDMVHCTLFGNTVELAPQSGFSDTQAQRVSRSQLKGGGLFAQKPPAGDSNSKSGRIQVINTLIAGNSVAGLVPAPEANYGGPSFEGKYEVDQNGVSRSGNGLVSDHNVIGGNVASIFEVNPQTTLALLKSNGGPTQTIALANNPSNPALGTANANVGILTKSDNVLTDQRGFLRSSTAPSVGAFEPVVSPTLLVTTTVDEDNGDVSPNLGSGTSLREAISIANSLSSPSTITFDSSLTGRIVLTQGALTLTNTNKITIQGPGADKLALEGSGTRILSIPRLNNPSLRAVAEISGLTFRNGIALGNGGAIENNGNLILLNSEFLSNQALPQSTTNNNGGGGGAISNNGLLEVFGSTFNFNRAHGNDGGGGIANFGTALVVNSTFTQNLATNTLLGGGAIKNDANLTLINNTLTNNSANAGGGLFTKTFSAGPSAVSTVVNTIISGNLSLPAGNNPQTSQNVGGAALATGSSNNQIDGVVANILEVLPNNSAFPKLTRNGGSTLTVALKTDSPAINAGIDPNPFLTTFKLQNPSLDFDVDTLAATDQRGGPFKRVFNSRVDIGAFEFNQPTTIAVTTTGPTNSVSSDQEINFSFQIKNTSLIPAENVQFLMGIPSGVSVNGVSSSGGISVRTNSVFGFLFIVGDGVSLAANQTVEIFLNLRSGQSFAGKTLTFTPVVTTTTLLSAPIAFPPLAVSLVDLPAVPQFTGITTDGNITQTSVGVPLTFRLAIPPTTNGLQTAKINPTTVSVSDFLTTGTATARIDSVQVDTDNALIVQVTPTSAGTIGLAFSGNAEFKETFGRTVALPNPFTPPQITVNNLFVVSLATDEDDGDFSANDLSLREAIRLANQRAGSDTIQFAPNLGPITLTNELLLTDTNGKLSIFGPDGGTQVIQRSRIDGNRFRLFQIATGTSAAFRSLTLQNGSTTGNGAAILNFGSLDVDQTSLLFNDAGGLGGAIYNGGGTGQSLGLHRSTLSNNTADRGGAIANDNLRGSSTLIGELNTISGNSSRSHGGGILNVGNLTLSQSTIVLNRADSDGINGGDGGGLAAFNVETLFSTIIAGNLRGTGTTSSDIGGGFVDTKVSNVVGDNASGGAITNGVNGNIVGINGSGTIPLASILNPTLANNGGPTQTHALVALSLARDAGAVETRQPTDQRGQPIVNANDIGAFEYQPQAGATIALPDFTETTIFVGDGKTLILNEVITGPITASLTKTGPGRLVLAGNNTYLGPTNIKAGTVTLRHSNALGTGLGSQGTTVAAGASVVIDVGSLVVTELLTLNGNGVNNAGALQLIATPNDTAIRNGTWSGPITLATETTIGVDSGSSLSILGGVSGSKGLTKVGPGLLSLAGTNTYTGPTSINSGEMTFNSLPTTSAITLNGGTLGGVGSTTAVTSNPTTASRLSPTRDGIGQLKLNGNLTLNGNTAYDAQINGTSPTTNLDNIDVTGTVTLNNATLNLSLVSGFVSTVGNKYQIITNDGSDLVVGTFNGLAEGATLTVNNQKFQISYVGGSGNDVVLTHVNTNSAFRERTITSIVGETGIVTLQGRIVEFDPLDQFTLTINWGDGRTERKKFPAGSAGQLVTLTHQYRAVSATPYIVSLEWVDQHGGGNSDRLSVLVKNIAPTVTISGPATLNAGQPQTFNFKATDPDPKDLPKKTRWTIDWGDGTSQNLSKPAMFSLAHTYNQAGDYTVRVVATDRDGLVSAITTHQVHAESISSQTARLRRTMTNPFGKQ